MTVVIFILAAIAGAGGVVLWVLDSRSRSAASDVQVQDTWAVEDSSYPAVASGESFSALPDASTEVTAEQPAVTDAQLEQPDSLDAYEDVYGDAYGEYDSENLAEGEENLESEQDTHEGRGWFRFPGKKRRERVTWVSAHGFSEFQEDHLLDNEWTRGPAARKNVKPRDILQGEIEGYETYICDLGGSTVIALRRGAASPIIVDMVRTEISSEEEAMADDLLEIGECEGFVLWCSDPEPTQRFIDPRVTHALSMMPEDVEGVWLEADWVVADMPKGTPPEVWEATFAPLALLADAARLLPPVPSVAQVMPEEDLDMPRPMALPDSGEAPGEDEDVDKVEDVPVLQHPEVLRPEHPVAAPTRSRSTTFGSVTTPQPLGGDEVAPIAAGEEQTPQDTHHGTRVVRNLSRGASIFEDLAAELGDPQINMELPDWDAVGGAEETPESGEQDAESEE